MLLYQVLHAVDRSYGLTIFWIYLAAFVFTFSLIFIFPPGAIVMIFLGLLGLGIAVMGGAMIGISTRAVARRVLVRGRCPRCDHLLDPRPDDASDWCCPGCRTRFQATGAEPEISPHAHPHDEG